MEVRMRCEINRLSMEMEKEKQTRTVCFSTDVDEVRGRATFIFKDRERGKEFMIGQEYTITVSE